MSLFWTFFVNFSFVTIFVWTFFIHLFCEVLGGLIFLFFPMNVFLLIFMNFFSYIFEWTFFVDFFADIFYASELFWFRLQILRCSFLASISFWKFSLNPLFFDLLNFLLNVFSAISCGLRISIRQSPKAFPNLGNLLLEIMKKQIGLFQLVPAKAEQNPSDLTIVSKQKFKMQLTNMDSIWSHPTQLWIKNIFVNFLRFWTFFWNFELFLRFWTVFEILNVFWNFELFLKFWTVFGILKVFLKFWTVFELLNFFQILNFFLGFWRFLQNFYFW